MKLRLSVPVSGHRTRDRAGLVTGRGSNHLLPIACVLRSEDLRRHGSCGGPIGGVIVVFAPGESGGLLPARGSARDRVMKRRRAGAIPASGRVLAPRREEEAEVQTSESSVVRGGRQVQTSEFSPAPRERRQTQSEQPNRPRNDPAASALRGPVLLSRTHDRAVPDPGNEGPLGRSAAFRDLARRRGRRMPGPRRPG